MPITPQELEALLNKWPIQINKIAKEQSDRFDVLVAANKTLQDLLDAAGTGGTITEEIATAAANAQAALDGLDASIPDAPA